jgi:hypothetical protein
MKIIHSRSFSDRDMYEVWPLAKLKENSLGVWKYPAVHPCEMMVSDRKEAPIVQDHLNNGKFQNEFWAGLITQHTISSSEPLNSNSDMQCHLPVPSALDPNLSSLLSELR